VIGEGAIQECWAKKTQIFLGSPQHVWRTTILPNPFEKQQHLLELKKWFFLEYFGGQQLVGNLFLTIN